MPCCTSPPRPELLQVSLPHQAPPVGRGGWRSLLVHSLWRPTDLSRGALGITRLHSSTTGHLSTCVLNDPTAAPEPPSSRTYGVMVQGGGSWPFGHPVALSPWLFRPPLRGPHPPGPHCGPARARGSGLRSRLRLRDAPAPAPRHLRCPGVIPVSRFGPPRADATGPSLIPTQDPHRQVRPENKAPHHGQQHLIFANPHRRFDSKSRRATAEVGWPPQAVDQERSSCSCGCWMRSRSERCLRRGIGRHRDGGGAVADSRPVGACAGCSHPVHHQPRQSRADAAHGVQVVRTVARSTWTP